MMHPSLGYSGFYKTSVSKCCFVSSIAISLYILFFGQRYRRLFAYNIDEIFVNCAIWRLGVSKLAFLSTTDLILGSGLIYHFRIFERRYGSRKYAMSLIWVVLLSTLLELLSCLALRSIGRDPHDLPSGPFYFIYPYFISFWKEVPNVSITKVGGLPISTNWIFYLIGLRVCRFIAISNGSFSWHCHLLRPLLFVDVDCLLASFISANSCK
uniref:Rhomboid domain-containing protein n=1 Tax=Mesocestoides corti TaxID=53468 RepID=A0A5K3F580_MESCO